VKLLLDENLPHKLRNLLPGHDCYTATYMGWSGVENGELLRLAADNGFDAFISTDGGLEYEQNQDMLPLAVVVLIAQDNKRKTLESLMPLLLEALKSVKAKNFLKVESKG
jgi:predicted nuclease of predicted toxin-antitoxin system